MALWAIRICFLALAALTGYAVSQLQPSLIEHPYGVLLGFGLGGFLIAIDEMLKGFSLRAFSSATFGLVLGSIIAWLIDRSELFKFADDDVRWIIRLGLFLCFGYIGIVLAMRSNKEDFSLIIPYVRFKAHNQSENVILLDTNVIIDGRIAEIVETRFIEGIVVIPRFILRELQLIADSADEIRRARGRRGLDMLKRLQQSAAVEVKIHEADFSEEPDVDSKLLRLARALGAKVYTNDYNLGAIAELQGIPHVNLSRLAVALKPVILPGEIVTLRIVREGKERGQGIGYMPDGTMVVVSAAQQAIGREVQAQINTLRQTGAGVIIFADLKVAAAA